MKSLERFLATIGNNSFEGAIWAATSQVHTADQAVRPLTCHSFFGRDRQISSCPPARRKKGARQSPCTGVYTHTHRTLTHETRTTLNSGPVMCVSKLESKFQDSTVAGMSTISTSQFTEIDKTSKRKSGCYNRARSHNQK